jgi:hypothetical protein
VQASQNIVVIYLGKNDICFVHLQNHESIGLTKNQQAGSVASSGVVTCKST